MTGGCPTREAEIPPRASVLVESLRDIGYSLQTAVADVIDNSLTAGARTIELLAETHAESPAIGILDDGAGMTEVELLEAMRPGSRSPLEDRGATDLGRFGLGLNSPWQESPLHSPGVASRLTSLLVGCIWPICALLTPCQPGATPVSVRRGAFHHGLSRRHRSRNAGD